MRQVAFLAVLAIVCLQTTTAGLADKNLPKRAVFKYEGKIVTRNQASEDHAATWVMSGQLLVDSSTDQMYTMKLNDVKTGICNGDTMAYENATEKEIPAEAKAILNPFVLTRGKHGFSIASYPDEPVWSLNMKRSIANIFFLKNDLKTNSIEREDTIYGNCKVSYVINKDNHLNIQKSIVHDSCKNGSMFMTSNVGWDPTANDHKTVQVKTFRRYVLDDNEELKSLSSESKIIYQSMPSVRSKQLIYQSQLFEREAITTDFEPIDISKNTETHDITFDFSEQISGGRDTTEPKSTTELIEYFLNSYNEFKDHFETYPIKHVTTDMNDTLTYMYEALELMDKAALEKLGEQIVDKDENLLIHSFISYLPYLGTEASLKYIKEIVKNDSLSDLLTIKTLAMVPMYAQNLNESVMSEMEDLMRLNVSNPQVKYSGILSFAALVARASNEETVNKDVAAKYVAHYMEEFESKENAEIYEMKMTYLLGLINMANILDKQTMISIISNPHESSHIRVLGTYGFKKALEEESDEVYKTFWPITKNESEPFEVRVAALDLLMYTNLAPENFQSIVNWYHHELSDPSEQHIANYLYTTLESLQNNTGYYEYMGDEATEALKTLTPPKSARAWATGNYRSAYTDTDSNFGASFQARMISNPVTNVLNSALVSADNFAIGVNLGVYSMYIKLEGVEDNVFAAFALKDIMDDDPVPKLMELLKQHKYILKEPGNIHIEVVFFCDHKVVFGMHINKNNIANYLENALFTDLLALVLDYNSISYPVLDYTNIVSDLGTGITVSKEITEIASYELINIDKLFSDVSTTDVVEYEFKYRSTWYYSLYTECYNPLAGASIATYKYVGKEVGVHLPYSFNITDLVFKWKNIPDMVNYVEDHLIGTMVDDKEILHKYCSNCGQFAQIPVGEMDYNEAIPFYPLGIYANLTMSQPNIYQTNLHLGRKIPIEVASSFLQTNQDVALKEPAAQVLLLFYYLNNYYTYLDNDLKVVSVTISPIHEEKPSETILDFDLHADDVTSGKDPISGTVFNVSLSYSVQEIKTAEELGYLNLGFKYESISKSVGDASPHMDVKYDFECEFSTSDNKNYKMCLQRDEINPSRRSNRYSLEPIEDTKVETHISYGEVDSKHAHCLDEDIITITEVYSSTPRQKAIMEGMSEYTNCKLQSHGLKYTPPTDDCIAAHETISQYDAIDIYFDSKRRFINETLQFYLQSTNEVSAEHDLSICRINDTHLHVNLNASNTHLSATELNNCYLGETLDSIIMNPNSIAYDDNELRLGFESACHITNKRVRTFTEHIIKNYYEHSNGDPIAFIECVNVATHGLTVQKLDNIHIGFTFWSNNNTIVASAENGNMKIMLNDKEVTKSQIISDEVKVYFLDTDVIYISTDMADIFYNTEYITIKIYSGYHNYICGLCAETRHQ